MQIEENAQLAKKKIEERIPGITENTTKLGEDLSSEAQLIYENTIKSTVEAATAKVIF